MQRGKTVYPPEPSCHHPSTLVSCHCLRPPACNQLVRVHSALMDETITAARVIVTVPLPVLQVSEMKSETENTRG